MSDTQTHFAVPLSYAQAAKGFAGIQESSCRLVVFQHCLIESAEGVGMCYIPAQSVEIQGLEDVVKVRDLCNSILEACEKLRGGKPQ